MTRCEQCYAEDSHPRTCQKLGSLSVVGGQRALQAHTSQGRCSRTCRRDPSSRAYVSQSHGGSFWGCILKVNRNGEEKNRGKLIGFYLVTMSSECLSRQNTPFNRKSSARTPLQAQPPLLLSPLQRPSGKSCMYLLPECSPLSLSLWNQAVSPEALFWLSWGDPPLPTLHLQCQIQRSSLTCHKYIVFTVNLSLRLQNI